MATVSVTQARAALLDLLSRVDGGEEVTITRHGRPVAVVVRPDALRSRRADGLEADAETVRDVLRAAGSAPLPRSKGVSPDRADELVREIRAGRRRR